MKLKILGSSSSGNCYLLIGEKETLILEAGIHYKDILKGLDFNISNVCGCLVTHEHMDHAKAIQDLTKNSIDVYASKGTLMRSAAMQHRGKEIESEKQFKVGGFTILPFSVEHDAAEPLGFLIQHKECGKILFATDTYYIKYNFKGLNHILIEANYSEDILRQNIEDGIIPVGLAARVTKSHFSLENVKGFLKASDLSKLQEIVLIHLSGDNSDPGKFQREIEKATGKTVYVARKGLEIDLSIF